MMQENMNIRELHDLIAKLESRLQWLKNRREQVVAELSAIEEEIRKILGSYPSNPSKKPPRGKAAHRVPQPADSRPAATPRRRVRSLEAAVAAPVHVVAARASNAATSPKTGTGPADVLDAPAAPPRRRSRQPKASVATEVPVPEAPKSEPESSEALIAVEVAPPETLKAELFASVASVDMDLTECLVRILRTAGHPLRFEELAVKAGEAGFAREDLVALIRDAVLNGPFRETVEGVMLRQPKASAIPLAGLLDE